ncbi:leucine-rich repeat-containing protein 74A-like isoform X2 [Ruditapes philippinarum]|uniref:leucine-rich repeat-containing protein 74A-like isoform X2 n=1 Tax=Ruditapes philippinarum TaxID=129788 RepID=UPI00295A9C5B|nr:leucine-rich repeat-containing protein 74A-like isoform X2 [Ruditapes philippinarum]
MRTESGNVEGHSAVLKLHKGAHMSRTTLGGTRTKIVHSHTTHTRAQPVTRRIISDPQTGPVTQSALTQLNSRRRSSCASTQIHLPDSKSNRTSEAVNVQSVDTQNVTEKTNIIRDKDISKCNEQVQHNPKTEISEARSRRISVGYGYQPPQETRLPNTIKEFSFDSDDDDEAEKEKQAEQKSITDMHTDNYNRMCKLQGITPCGSFKRQISDSVADVSNSLLGTKDVKSICVSLASNVTIKELDLSGNDLSDKGAKYVAEALRENNTVEDLSLSRCNIDLPGLQALGDLFIEQKPMTRIDLSKNKFERKHAEIMANIIQKNDYIEEVVLSENKFDEVGGVYLGKAIGSNVGMKKLDLSWNHLRREGAKAVCMSLKSNNILEELDLSWNGLAEDGCRALAEALPCNHTLKELDVSCNRISIFCLKDLLKGLEKNDTLKVLRINQNPLTTDGAIAVIKCLQKSKVSQLTDLYMTDIPINPDFLDELDELLKIRQVRVFHRDPNKKKVTPIIRQRTLKDYDPAMILFEYMKQENLRLIDLFRTFDTDSSQSVSKDELKEGFVTINMPLTDDALDSLFERLDINDNDEIEYDEVKSGYRKTVSKIRGNDGEAQQDAMAGLRKLIHTALAEKRTAMRTNAAQRVLQRRQSLQAVFQIRK